MLFRINSGIKELNRANELRKEVSTSLKGLKELLNEQL